MGWLLSPLSWLLLGGLGICVACAAARRWRGWARNLLVASAILTVVAVSFMTPLVANLLVGWLERPMVPPAGCVVRPPDVAVVLAGGIDGAGSDEADPDRAGRDGVDRDGVDVSALGITSRRRMERAVTWWGAKPGRRLVVAGGPMVAGEVPPSRLMVRVARGLGVDAGSMLTEETSVNTWGNARNLARLPDMPRRVVLVTSAMHMPRASFAMRHAGFEVCPVPADRRQVALGWPGAVIPRSSALRKSEAALHEVVGLAWYRLRAFADSSRLARDELARDGVAGDQGLGGTGGPESPASGESGVGGGTS